MKTKTALLLLLLAMLLPAFGAQAAGLPSTVGTESGFMVRFDGDTATRAHAMHLEAGDSLTLSVILQGGDIHITVRPDGGTSLYDSSDVPAPGFTIDIGQSGLYRLTVDGTDAVGSVWMQRTLKSEQQPGGMPIPREYRQSDLGYALEYETDSFRVESVNEDTQPDTMPTDIYIATGDGAQDAQAMLIVTQLRGSHDEQADLYALTSKAYGDGEVQEQLPTVIDGRAARHFRYESGDGKVVREVLFVEAGESVSLSIQANYSAETKEIGKKMEDMIQSIVFLY